MRAPLTRLFALPSKGARKGRPVKDEPTGAAKRCHHAGISRYMFSKGGEGGGGWINTGSGFTAPCRAEQHHRSTTAGWANVGENRSREDVNT